MSCNGTNEVLGSGVLIVLPNGDHHRVLIGAGGRKQAVQIGFDARLVAYRDGGIARYIRSLLHALIAIDRVNKYTILVDRSGTLVLTGNAAEVVTHRALLTPPHHRLERVALSLELGASRFDLFHSPDFIPPRLRRNTRTVITVHDLAFLRDPDLLDEQSRRYYGQIHEAVKRADAIIAPSEATRNDLLTLTDASPAQIAVVPEAADSHYRPLDRTERIAALQALARANVSRDMIRLISGEFGPFILFVGTIEPRKNLLTLLQAYAQYRQSAGRGAATLVIAGAVGWQAEAELTQIQTLRSTGKVVWFDRPTDNQLLLLYNAASVLALPSHYEGFGLTAIEGMACGTPVLASNCSSLPEVVGDAGILLPPDDPTAWATTLETIVGNRQERERLIAAGSERAATFSWNRAAKETLAVYRRVMGDVTPTTPLAVAESCQH